MSSNNEPRDPCPVCCDRIPQNGRTYCSEKCVTSGYNFRKRISEVLRHLKKLGFSAEYINGVQLMITVPDPIAQHYPDALRTIDFPSPCLDIEQINASHLWETLRFHLGYMVTGTIKFLMEGEHFSKRAMHEMIQTAIKEAKNDLPCHFHCAGCERDFVLSARSVHTLGGSSICVDCAILAIPF